MLFAPQFGGQLLGIPLPPEMHIMGRVFGIRDLMLGGLLWKACSRHQKALTGSDTALVKDSRRDLKNLLLVGIVIDAVDVASSAISIWNGDMQGRVIVWVTGGATALVGLQWLALRLGKFW